MTSIMLFRQLLRPIPFCPFLGHFHSIMQQVFVFIRTRTMAFLKFNGRNLITQHAAFAKALSSHVC